MSAIDETTFQATADALDDEGIKLAPLLDSARTLRSVIADYTEYYDGFFRRNGSVIEAGHFDHGDIDDTGLAEFDSDDIAEGEPQITPGTLEDTRNHFDVVFTNREEWWTDDTESF